MAPEPVLIGAKPMHLPLKEIAAYIRRAPTAELLDRVTIYRDGMEPAALDLMEGELDRRRITREQIAEYDAALQAAVVRRADGSVRRCERCERPAVHQHRGWHKLCWFVPVFRRSFYLCEEHRSDERDIGPETPQAS
ncbi:hypothetical protein C1280_17865 [Gemmata obscuriglobus]|uniref:Uncharacterized protein n=2 Tax=Gemmata obscuriglobus TaxID=114 RepID=A0A2Z3H513_9BACT|nr:hypothetical protein C1280_17865 [Gemmata obscuriglobus]